MSRPTGHKLSPITLQRVLDRIDAGFNNSQIHRATGVWPKTTAKIQLSLEYWGQPYSPATVRRGRPPTLRRLHAKGLLDYVNSRPQAYLEEMRDWLYDEYDILTTIWTVYRELERADFSRKLGTKRAIEHSEPIRRVWSARVAQNYIADQIVAIDESACDECTSDRKYGWPPVGVSVELSYSIRRSERRSVLPAMAADG